MLYKILNTKLEITPLIIRLTLGGIMFAHGAQKMLGWFGGYGFNATMQYFTGAGHMHYISALFVILIEFFCSLMLIFGAFTRIAALGIFGLFAGIIYNVAAPNGFFMNWGGDKKGEGYEYHLLVLGMALALIIAGAGALSIDRKFSSK